MTAREVLVEARKLVGQNWGQGHRTVTEAGCYCASTALDAACRNARAWELERSAVKTFCLAAGCSWPGHGAIISWNDAEDRTHAEVLAAFDRAIARCRA